MAKSATSDPFVAAAGSLPRMLVALLLAEKITGARRLDIPLRPGVYLFSEEGRPVYVGRTKKLRNRYDQHTGASRAHNQASFAFLMAKAMAAAAGLSVKRTRKQLQADPYFGKHFLAAKSAVAAMDFQFVECSDAVVRALFEIYAALQLGTDEFNKFEEH